MASKKKVSTATVTARFPAPAKDDPESLFALTQQQVAGVMACPDFANQAAVQAITKALQADTTELGTLIGGVASAKAAVPVAEAKRDAQVAVVRRGRHNLSGALTAICGGVPATIQSWGATPAGGVPTPASAAAPTELTATPSKTVPGTVRGKCLKVPGAASYLWALTTDPNVAPTTVQPVVTPGSRVSIPGQPVGHVMYLRVAVVRRRGGQSAFSEAVQITVR